MGFYISQFVFKTYCIIILACSIQQVNWAWQHCEPIWYWKKLKEKKTEEKIEGQKMKKKKVEQIEEKKHKKHKNYNMDWL